MSWCGEGWANASEVWTEEGGDGCCFLGAGRPLFVCVANAPGRLAGAGVGLGGEPGAGRPLSG